MGPEYLQDRLVVRFLKEPLSRADRDPFVARLKKLSSLVVQSRMLLPLNKPRTHDPKACPVCASIRAFKMKAAGIGAAVASAAAASAVAGAGSGSSGGNGDSDDCRSKRHRAS